MNKETMLQRAWIGSDWVQGPIRGVVMAFHGLGTVAYKTELSTQELSFAHAGGLVVFPYYGPWCWMNRDARDFVDELIDSVYSQYGLSNDLPLILTGGSMGGFSALYSRYAKRKIAGCIAVCPVCDLEGQFHFWKETPRTVYDAFRGYPEDMKTLFREHSPLHQVEHMPDIPYLIVHGSKDTSVPKAMHSDAMVSAMRKRGLKVDYMEIPFMDHGGPVSLEMLVREQEFVARLLGK